MIALSPDGVLRFPTLADELRVAIQLHPFEVPGIVSSGGEQADSAPAAREASVPIVHTSCDLFPDHRKCSFAVQLFLASRSHTTHARTARKRHHHLPATLELELAGRNQLLDARRRHGHDGFESRRGELMALP